MLELATKQVVTNDTYPDVFRDLFSLFAAVTFVGIAVDYGIYVLYRYVFEPSSTMADVMARTGSAIAIARVGPAPICSFIDDSRRSASSFLGSICRIILQTAIACTRNPP